MDDKRSCYDCRFHNTVECSQIADNPCPIWKPKYTISDEDRENQRNAKDRNDWRLGRTSKGKTALKREREKEPVPVPPPIKPINTGRKMTRTGQSEVVS